MIRTPMLYVIAQFALFGIFFITYWTLPGSSTGILPTIGGISVAVAFAVLAAAGYEHLARNRSLPNITPTPQSQSGLITTGIYARIRHPIYTAVFAAFLGAALQHGHPLLFLFVGVLIVFFTFKSRYEEALLVDQFPTEYPAYRARTWRFLPFV